jgi:hypothetical protein
MLGKKTRAAGTVAIKGYYTKQRELERIRENLRVAGDAAV